MTVKIGIMQPYFFPYIGYFQLINAVDKYVIYDDVNYIKNGWINRNNILLKDKSQLITIPIENASSFKLINETYIKDDRKKARGNIIKSLKANYSKATYFQEIFDLIEGLLIDGDENIATFNEQCIKSVCDYLNISTSILRSSNIHGTNHLSSENRVIAICKKLDGDLYVNAIGGKGLYKKNNFVSEGIDLKFLRADVHINYHQYKSDFVPNLSIIDVLMFNGKSGTKELLSKYQLEG
jgi:hypothetical protein